MNKPLHERLAALRDFLSPPSANALTPPGLDLLDEAVKVLTPPKAGAIPPTAIEMPWPSMSAGMRLVTGAYARSAVADYGNARAAERDAFWKVEIDRMKRVNGAELVEFLGIDPVSLTAGAHQPMIPDSWRFGFVQPDGSLLRFQRMNAGPLVAWEAVARFITPDGTTEAAYWHKRCIDAEKSLARVRHGVTTAQGVFNDLDRENAG